MFKYPKLLGLHLNPATMTYKDFVIDDDLLILDYYGVIFIAIWFYWGKVPVYKT